jgi:hypothetical protein
VPHAHRPLDAPTPGRRPPLDAPLRVAFLGPAPTCAVHALHAPAGGLRPTFLDVRADVDPVALATELRALAPHVVVALDPAVVPVSALAGLRAATLACSPAAGYDRALGVWRALPLPVDDALFAPVRRSASPPRPLFLGASTPHREGVLIGAKHAHEVVHYAHGLVGARLAEVLAAADVGIGLRESEAPGFAPGALVHLAAGHLLLCERLAPTFGLEPGIDHLTFRSPGELLFLLDGLRLRPDAYERVRLWGRAKAEGYRASVVWPRVVGDLLRELAALTPRSPA